MQVIRIKCNHATQSVTDNLCVQRLFVIQVSDTDWKQIEN